MISVIKIYHTKKKGDLRAKLRIVENDSIRTYAVKCGKRNSVLSLQSLGLEIIGIDSLQNNVTIRAYPSNRVHILTKFSTSLNYLRQG